MKKLMFILPVLLAACAAKAPVTEHNRASTFVMALDPEAKCESSVMLADVQRRVDGKPLEQIDAALCISDGMLYACHAGYEQANKKTSCAPLMDARSPDAKAQAAAKAATQVPPAVPPIVIPTDAGAGSGSAK